MSLKNELLLIIDQNGDGFVEDLLNALVAAEGEALVAHTETEALDYLKRFEFSALLVGDPPHFEKHLADAIGGVPIIFYGSAPSVVRIRPEWVTVQRDIPSILRALKFILSAP